MLVDLQGRTLKRTPVDGVDLTDLIPGARAGPSRWTEDPTGAPVLDIPWDPEPAPADVDRVRVRLTTSGPNEEDLVTKARNALTANSSFLALPSPTNAQVLTQVRALTRENTALIRLLMAWLDSTEGT